MKFNGRTAVITGASSGIGAALAQRLAQEGVAVGLTARREERIRDLAESIRSRGGVAFATPSDAANPESTKQAIRQLAERLERIDLLVANAGLSAPSDPHLVFDASAFTITVQVNLLGAAWAIDAALPEMLERRSGHIVGISSPAGYRGLPGTAGYSASKAGLSILLESLRVDLRNRGVRVTTVHPGFVRTPMTVGSRHRQPWMMDVETAVSIILKGIASGRAEINFPWPMVAMMAIVRRLPNSIYDRLAGLVLSGESGK